MPIIEQVSVEMPLSQGDILKGVPLFLTEKCWEDAGGNPRSVNDKLCLVISRPCALAHKGYAAVVPIEQYKGTIPGDVKTFDDLLKFLTFTRDGRGSPDVFYLGEIAGKVGKFCARLDSLHTIEIPEEQDARGEFVKERRIARLCSDFARDLHLRLFYVFASLGFDDVAWFSDGDLDWALEKGAIDLADAEKVLAEKKAARSQKGFEGGQYPETQVKSAEERVEQVRNKLAPFEAERAKRQKK